MRELVIDGTRIADDTDCWVIAEIGHNHQGSLETCRRLIKAAKDSGANAVKLQKRDNKALYSKECYDSPYNSENAYGATYGAHREALEFGVEQYRELQAYSRSLGVTFFATAFDPPSLEFLIELCVPAVKIASGDLTNISLLKEVAGWGGPVIFSTGGGMLADVQRAYDIVQYQPHAVLQCTSGYPAKFEELNLRVIETYRGMFPETVVGLSDHDKGIAIAPVAYALGARIVEKHFTLDRTWKGTDQAFSLEPVGLRKMVRDLKRARQAMGDGIKRRYVSEIEPLKKQLKNADGQIDGNVALSVISDAVGEARFAYR
jgi:sialic acid synthase